MYYRWKELEFSVPSFHFSEYSILQRKIATAYKQTESVSGHTYQYKIILRIESTKCSGWLLYLNTETANIIDFDFEYNY